MEYELKPCPCCGDEHIYFGYSETIPRALIECGSCGVGMEEDTTYLSEEEAYYLLVRKWNKRW